jgi:hypothetical protein
MLGNPAQLLASDSTHHAKRRLRFLRGLAFFTFCQISAGPMQAQRHAERFH